LEPATKPFKRVAVDVIFFTEAYNNNLHATHLVCDVTSYQMVGSHAKASTMQEVVEEFVIIIEARGFKIWWMKTDSFHDDKFDTILRKHGIIREASTPYTPAQNGLAKRSGRTITTIARKIRIGLHYLYTQYYLRSNLTTSAFRSRHLLKRRIKGNIYPPHQPSRTPNL
jgi:hypothetical protein